MSTHTTTQPKWKTAVANWFNEFEKTPVKAVIGLFTNPIKRLVNRLKNNVDNSLTRLDEKLSNLDRRLTDYIAPAATLALSTDSGVVFTLIAGCFSLFAGNSARNFWIKRQEVNLRNAERTGLTNKIPHLELKKSINYSLKIIATSLGIMAAASEGVKLAAASYYSSAHQQEVVKQALNTAHISNYTLPSSHVPIVSDSKDSQTSYIILTTPLNSLPPEGVVVSLPKIYAPTIGRYQIAPEPTGYYAATPSLTQNEDGGAILMKPIPFPREATEALEKTHLNVRRISK